MAEFIRKPRHRTSDANAAHWGDLRSNQVSYVGLHHRSLASELYDTERRSILFRKLRLLLISASVAALMECTAEKPSRPKRVVKGYHGARPENIDL